MKSELRLDEVVSNEDRKFGANMYYYPCIVVDAEGNEHNALFTADQIEVALDRASKNPEDIPEETLWDWLFGE